MSYLILKFKPSKEESFFPYLFQDAGGKKVARRYKDRIKAVEVKLSKIEPETDRYRKIEKQLSETKEISEEADKYFGQYEDRFTWLDWTYNLCQSRMFRRKYPKARKPIKVVHFKLEHQSTIDCFYKGLNSHKAKVVTDRVGDLFFKYCLLDPSQKR